MFELISRKSFETLVRLVKYAVEDRDNIFSTGLLYHDDRIDANAIYSALHQEALNRENELQRVGIYVVNPKHSNEKFFLMIPEYDCLIRFGKMDANYHMSKKHRRADKRFAEQQYELPGIKTQLNLHLGYVLDKDGVSVSDIALAQPISINRNVAITKMSDGNYSSDLFNQHSDNSVPASGTLLDTLQRMKSKEETKSV